MAITPPEVKRVLEQVEVELMAMLTAVDVVGQITVHCGAGDLTVEVMTKRKRKPVRLERTHLPQAITSR